MWKNLGKGRHYDRLLLFCFFFSAAFSDIGDSRAKLSWFQLQCTWYDFSHQKKDTTNGVPRYEIEYRYIISSAHALRIEDGHYELLLLSFSYDIEFVSNLSVVWQIFGCRSRVNYIVGFRHSKGKPAPASSTRLLFCFVIKPKSQHILLTISSASFLYSSQPRLAWKNYFGAVRFDGGTLRVVEVMLTSVPQRPLSLLSSCRGCLRRSTFESYNLLTDAREALRPTSQRAHSAGEGNENNAREDNTRLLQLSGWAKASRRTLDTHSRSPSCSGKREHNNCLKRLRPLDKVLDDVGVCSRSYLIEVTARARRIVGDDDDGWIAEVRDGGKGFRASLGPRWTTGAGRPKRKRQRKAYLRRQPSVYSFSCFSCGNKTGRNWDKKGQVASKDMPVLVGSLGWRGKGSWPASSFKHVSCVSFAQNW